MSDVFDRLKKKARPTVPERDTTLVKPQNEELHNDVMTEVSHSVNTKKVNLGNHESPNNHSHISHQEQDLDLPQIIRRTIRLEQEVDDKLENFCNAQKITRDTFIEAAFVICLEDEELMHKLLDEAKKRYYQRKQAGEKRKFQTMARKNSVSEF
ncbi:MAG: hypothetical protein AB3A66_29985 (plasmid) [Nodularia sp. CChRGM 3473]